MNEIGRQVVHIIAGMGLVLLGWVYGKQALLTGLVGALCVGLVLINLKILKARIPVIDFLLAHLERKDAEFPGKGALNYAVGAILAITFPPDYSFALAVIAMLALGDGMATLVGTLRRRKRTRLHWHARKSLEGTAAFFAFGTLAAAPFIGIGAAAFYSLALAFLESLDINVDDNLLLPVGALALNYFVNLIL